MKRSAEKILMGAVVAYGLLTLAGIILRTVSLFGFYDKDIGYYQTAAILPDVFHFLCILAIGGGVAFALVLPAKKAFAYSSPNALTSTVRAGATSVLVGVCAYVFYVFLGMIGDTALYNANTSKTGKTIELVAMIFGIMAIIYFALIIAGKTSKGNRHVYFGYLTILFVLMILAKTYFDFHTTMNSPNKLLLQSTLMLVMLYVLYEQRFSIEKSNPRLFAAVALMTFYFTAVCSVPGIIAFFGGVLKKNDYFVYHFLILGLAVYVFSMLVSFTLAQKKK